MAKRIESLDSQQAAVLAEYRDRWLRIGLDTNPANRAEAEAAVRLAYECGGLPPPKIVVWLRSPLEGAIGAAMFASLKASGRAARAQVGAQVWDQVGAQVGAQVWAQVRAQVRDQVWDQVWAQVGAAGYGQHDASWLGFYEFFLDACQLDAPNKLRGLMGLARSCGWFWPFEGVVVLTERPVVLQRDARHRLHREDGPALLYSDGFALWRWHGVAVPRDVVESPEKITLKHIEGETNAEVRRIMVERYGHERFLRESKAELIDSCPDDHELIGMRTAKLWRIADITMLDLLNSTPEPDGSVKRYVIPVDGDRYDGRAGRECIAASASTWRKRGDPTQLAFARPEDYRPAFES